MTFEHPALSPAGAARTINALGIVDLRIPAATTAGEMSVWESLAGPGEGPPMHVHSREDEMFYVLSGSFRFWCGAETFDGGPGTSAVLPRNVAHTYRNVGATEGRLLVAAMPGGFEEFFLEIERTGAAEPAAIVAIAGKYGLSFVPEARDALSVDEQLVTSA